MSQEGSVSQQYHGIWCVG